jgi:glycosyltransferase involved in cell wall biosynthesis
LILVLIGEFRYAPHLRAPTTWTANVTTQPRLILVDDNIRDVGGHYFELATLLLEGAQKLGYQPVLATNSRFDEPHAFNPTWKLHQVFHTRRLVRWSLGVDGNSQFQRDLSGNPVGVRGLQKLLAMKADYFVAPAKRPQKMLQQWSDDLCQLLAKIKPTPHDCLLVNTADDFSMLALANAMQRAQLPAMRIDVIFHFALYDGEQPDRKNRLDQIGRQIRTAIKLLHPHQVHLHATTDTLASQLRESECGTRVTSIPYPTRKRKVTAAFAGPLKAVLAGLPRAEKGKDAIANLLAGIEKTLLKDGRFRMSMQMPKDRWQSMIPKSLHPAFEAAVKGEANGPLEVLTANLSTADYHHWLDTANVGLFLYEPARYIARCSGVLLEMLVRGVPVIVPDHCWLADQVRIAGGHRSIGLIYQDRAEIPDLMQQLAQHRATIQQRASEYAQTITQRHDSQNTLREMGLKSVNVQHQAA